MEDPKVTIDIPEDVIEEDGKSKKPKAWWKKIITRFLQGLLIVLPIGLIIFLVWWLFGIVDGLLQPLVDAFLKWINDLADINLKYTPGMALLLTLIIVYLVGLLASNWLGHKIVSWFEGIIKKIPIVKQLYSGVQQIIKSITGTGGAGDGLNKAAFREVVIVEFPRKGMKTVGFITKEITSDSGEKLYNIYIPAAPFLTGGYYEIVTEDAITRTKITVDEALQMVISLGVISPEIIAIDGTSHKITQPKKNLHSDEE